jgi:hypothetical protein
MPWLAGLAAAGITAGTAAGAAGAGIGKQQTIQHGFRESGRWDPSAFQFGGNPMYADQERGRLQGLAGSLGTRGGPTWDLRNAQQTRGQQQDLIKQLQAGAAGNGPSAAMNQMQLGMDQSRLQQQGLAAGATGAGAANAQRQAMQNIAMGQQRNVNEASMLRSQEQQQAINQLGSVLGQARSQDFGEQQAQIQSQLQMQQMNDQLRMYYEKMGFDVATADMMAKQHGQQLMMQDYWNRMGANQQVGAANAQRDVQLLGFGLSGLNQLGGMAGGMAGGGGGK